MNNNNIYRDLNKHFINTLDKENQIIKEINNLYLANKKNTNQKNTSLIKYLSNLSILYIAYANLKSNAEISTKSIDNRNDQNKIQMKLFNEISENLKNDLFQWKPAKRTEMLKPESIKKKFFGIKNVANEIVQESIRIVLNAIYEPIFQEHEVNFGFRPKKSTHSAIQKIQKERRGTTTAIEGDIKEACDNIDSKIIVKILKKKIVDKKFLKLIESGFKASIFFEGETLEKKVFQGEIVSPLLFNIYMTEFDYEARNITNRIFKEKNTLEKRTEKSYSSEKHSKRKLFFSYTRYANDWIILTNGDNIICEQIIKELKTWLIKNLKLKLSEEKTKITTIKERAVKFLGFSIHDTETIALKRRLVTGFRTGIDIDRVKANFVRDGIIDNKKHQPIHCNKYAVLKTWQIVKIYLEILLCIYSYYYYLITFKSKLGWIHYCLTYSCYKTIAKREKSSISKVILKYGKKINVKYLDLNNGNEKKVSLLTYTEIGNWAEKKAISRKTREIQHKIEKKRLESAETKKLETKKLETEKFSHIESEMPVEN